MKIAFQRKLGDSDLGIAFFWRMQIDVDEPTFIEDHLIPELFFDYLLIAQGQVAIQNSAGDERLSVPAQSLKTLHTQSIKLHLKAPLVIFGARLNLAFAEISTEVDMLPNRFAEASWVEKSVDDLDSFAFQVTKWMRENKESSSGDAFPDSDQLKAYSARHQRRLYKKAFGLSRKEMQTIQNVHRFLEQSCDFSSDYPHIIDHVNDDEYYDQPHLNRAFKKVTGFTLLEYFEVNTILQDNLMAVSYKDDLS